jgi:DNA-binding CsgD family transcriptional regulator
VQLAQMHAIAEDWTELRAHLRAAEPLVAGADARDAIRFYNARALLRFADGDLDGWQRDSEEAARIARALGDPTLIAFVLSSYGVSTRKVGRFADAAAAFHDAAEAGRSYGPLYNVTFARLGYANVLYLTGRLSDARTEMLDILADKHESATIRILLAQFGVALAVALRDDTLAARCSSADLPEAAFSMNEAALYAPLAATIAEQHLANGEDEAAVALLQRMLASLPDGWGDCEALLPVAVCCPQPDVDHARARLDAALADRGNPFVAAYRALFDAYAAARFGSRDEKLRDAKAAAVLLRGLGMPLHEAEAYDLAEEQARTVALCERIGSLRLPRRLGPRPQRRSGTTQLTAREREVVDLALLGMSNRAIAGDHALSERTVEAHIAAAYRKLGVRTRSELINVLGRAGR